MRKLLVFILLFTFIATAADAQSRKRRGGSFKRKSAYKYELIASIGATNFLGDLGGANQIGTNGLKDLELALTRPAFGIGMRKKLMQYFTAKGNINWGIIRGDDKRTLEPFRNARNLNFKSNIFELSAQIEFNFIKEQKGHVYQIKGIRGSKFKDKSIYLFGGGGLVHFNPKGLYNGNWYALQPLSTEGQGIIPGTKKYKRTTGIISVGGGFRHAINKIWGIGFELGMRKSFSDYIDDVSGLYPDPAIYGNNAIAAALSNPRTPDTEVPCYPCTGQVRGDHTDKDAYLFGTFTIGYKMVQKKRSRSKF